jgi:hypothetical protein
MRCTCGLIGAALLVLPGCGEGGTAPPGDDEGRRLAAQFEQLADSVDSAGWSPTAEALRHAAEIVRLTGHATPVVLTLDGASRSFLAVAEQIDVPNLVCAWPGDSGIAPPPDTVVVPPTDSGTVEPQPGSGTPPAPPSSVDSAATPPGRTPGECTEVGVYSMRALIAWEPERMAEVVRLVADAGSNQVERSVPDVMTGLPTNAGDDPPSTPREPAPGDSAGGGSPGFPGFMGEYLVRDVGSWFAVEGRQANAIQGGGGACTADRARFDWAEFACGAARFRFEFVMRVAPMGVVSRPVPTPEPMPPPDRPLDEHAIAMPGTDVDGVRLTVVAWTPPLPPEPPGPIPPGPPEPPEPVPPDSGVVLE